MDRLTICVAIPLALNFIASCESISAHAVLSHWSGSNSGKVMKSMRSRDDKGHHAWSEGLKQVRPLSKTEPSRERELDPSGGVNSLLLSSDLFLWLSAASLRVLD